MLTLIKKHWLILAILLLAACLRLYRIYDYAEFLGDQGRDVVIVRDFLKNGNLFFIGPQTSVGNMYLGPFYYYLFVAPGLLLTLFNPVGPAIIVAVLGVLTVFIIYLITDNWFGRVSAYTSAILFALSPTVIKYSSFSWNPNIMPLFALLFVYFLIKKRYILATLAFIICLNSHFLALVLLPLAALILFLNRPLPLKRLLICLLIFVISLIPQILFDIRHQGQNLNSLITFFTQREQTVNLKAYKAIPGLWPLFVQINGSLLAGKNSTVSLGVSLLFIIFLIKVIYSQVKSKKIDTRLLILTAWYLLGLIGLGIYKQHVYDHYFGFLFPVVFILFGHLLSILPRYITIAVVLLLSFNLIAHNPFRYPPPRQIQTTYDIDRSIIDSSAGQPFNFALLAKMNYDPGYRYFLSELNAPVRLLQDEITEQLFVVCEPFQIDCQPINHPEWAVAAFGWAKIDSQWEINGIKVFKLVHNSDGS